MTNPQSLLNGSDESSKRVDTDLSEQVVKPVTTLELFFDIIFVFTVTQLTHTLSAELTLAGIVRVLLIFGVSWWMYSGYAWLTNHLSLSRILNRLLLLLSMGGFFVMALAIPHAFGKDALTFGLAYFTVVCMHTFLFFQSTRSITRIALFNIISASLVIAAAFVDRVLVYVAWCSVMVLQFITPSLVGIRGFSIHSGHFVERYGLLMIIALGESIIAVGIGLAELPLDSGLMAVALLGLALVACFWWAYFVNSNEKAEATLLSAEADQRSKLALHGFTYALVPMLLGIICVAVGLKKATEHPFNPLALRESVILSGGTALYLIGNVAFRKILKIGPVRMRICMIFAILFVFPLSMVSAFMLIISLLLIFLTGFIIETKVNRAASKG